MKTGIYVRVSTEEQAQEGYSIRGQEQKLIDYVRIKDWSVYKVYRDEGISGKNITDRPAINEMIDDIKTGKLDNVLVFKIDRLTRSTADLISLIEIFNDNDCCFNSLMESIDTHTASGRMFLKIIGIFAEFERENIVERTKLGFERKAREGYSLCTRTASFGYDRENGNKVQQINPYEAKIVLEVFDMFVNKHMSFFEIAQNLNERHIRTKEKGKWHSRSIKNMLTNCNYVGNVRYASKDKKRSFEATGVHEPIVSKKLFDEAQELILKISIKSYTKRPKEENYFSGVLVCDKCGGKLVTHGDYKNKEGHNGYRCSNYLRKTCNASNIMHKNVELAFLSYINDIADFDAVGDVKIREKENRQKRTLDAIESLNKQFSKLSTKDDEVLNSYISGSLEFDNYISIKSSIDKEKSRISAEIDNLELENDESEEIEIAKKDIIKNLKDNWELLSDIEKRQFLVRFIDNIRIVNEVPEGKRQGITRITNISFHRPQLDKNRSDAKTNIRRALNKTAVR